MDSPALSRWPILAILQHFLHFLGVAIAALAVAVMPKFVAMYRDLLAPEPLPSLTLFVLRLQPLWIVSTIVFALIAFYLLRRWWLRPVPGGISIALLLLPVAQAILIVIALMQPDAGTIIQMKPASDLTQRVR